MFRLGFEPASPVFDPLGTLLALYSAVSVAAKETGRTISIKREI
jgi:hypothetical protein